MFIFLLLRQYILFCEVPAVWLLFVKACAYCTSGVNITADSGSKMLAFYSIT